MSKIPAFTLTLEPMPGAELAECCAQAQSLADRMLVVVRFNFNGVNCNARPGGSQIFMARNLTALIGRQATKDPRQEAWS